MRSSPSPSWCRCRVSRWRSGSMPSGWRCAASGDSVRSACTDKERLRMIDPTTEIRRNPDVVFRSLEEEQGGVLLHLQSGAYHGLNDFGCLVWRLLEQERTFQSLADAVRAEAEDVPDSADEELSAFVEQLRERDLLVTSGCRATPHSPRPCHSGRLSTWWSEHHHILAAALAAAFHPVQASPRAFHTTSGMGVGRRASWSGGTVARQQAAGAARCEIVPLDQPAGR